ncbi:CAMK family protein kinase [Tritrichomonas foetus]|uniref:CAMK family protein kinase n=1 Tax=Tritrichomonas foetus TaxID=1144522 RepID=A0A1J4KSD4_9EUKA|nr:CAMK family protein kinase [Tritrichomonas foetus]|eukprot:OHT12724.1 CAMK family protein kinase [Tritrichomonas foetus]
MMSSFMTSGREIPKSNFIIAKKANLPFKVEKYTFTSVVGQGGFAEVYLVEDERFQSQFVAKVMTVDTTEMQHRWEVFDAEVTALSTLDHPNIIRLYDHFHVGTQFYLILEYCSGGSLHDEISKTNGLSYGRFVEVGKQIVHALCYCHEKGVAHRDIKPGNILLDNLARPRVADFGLSLRTHAGQLHRAFGGSLTYTAPEIFQKKPNDPMAGDVWALGVMFAVMATGSSPWPCESLGALKQMASSGQFQLARKVPDTINDLINRTIVVEPSQRLTMKQILAHPVFQSPTISRNFFGNKKPKSISPSKLKWNAISRSAIDRYEYDHTLSEDLDMYEEPISLTKLTSIHTASSVFLHSARKSKTVKSRVHRNSPSVFETFTEMDEEVLEVQ